MHTDSSLRGSKALIVIPGTVSYFYNSEGRRIAEALRNLGGEADVTLLQAAPPQDYDWCFFLNLWEIIYSTGDEPGAFAQIERIKARCKRTALVLLECVQMKWFGDSFALFQRAELDTFIDIGFHNQKADTPLEAQPTYHFIFNGLTEQERAAAPRAFTPETERPIPWAFVGHITPIRLDFLQDLLEKLDRRGFVYMVPFGAVTETGPDLNEDQFNQVLARTQYQIWCSHHPFFYIESLRFRMALLAGALPIKVDFTPFPGNSLFTYLIYGRDNFADGVRGLDFEATRQRFLSDFCAQPSLEAGLLKFLREVG
ncbi:MAG: hypothetical protein ABI835_12125 [Chloroflexota bacterium]